MRQFRWPLLLLSVLAGLGGSGCVWYEHQHYRHFRAPYVSGRYEWCLDTDWQYWQYHDTEEHRWDEERFTSDHAHRHYHDVR